MHQQLAIDFDANRSARKSDPQTSHEAARNAERFAASHAGRILAALKLHGPRSAHELSQLVGLSVVQIDRRLPDLKAAGLAEVAKLDDGADRTLGGFRVWRAMP
jgi:predicted ArsR family transcriptional regulator